MPLKKMRHIKFIDSRLVHIIRLSKNFAIWKRTKLMLRENKVNDVNLNLQDVVTCDVKVNDGISM